MDESISPGCWFATSLVFTSLPYKLQPEANFLKVAVTLLLLLLDFQFFNVVVSMQKILFYPQLAVSLEKYPR